MVELDKNRATKMPPSE
jgi:Trichohyalin-plectin-homology domain